MNPLFSPRLLFTLLISASSFTMLAQPTDSWSRKADIQSPVSNGGMIHFSIGQKGYASNGSGGIQSFWEYDPTTDAWTQKADFTGPGRSSGVAFSTNSKGYFGTGNSSGVNRTDFWEYDPIANQWTQKADFAGVARRNAIGFGVNEKGYLGAGYSDGPFTVQYDFWEYDPATDAWTSRANFPNDTYSGASGFTILNKGYVGNGNHAFYEFDPATNVWTGKASVPGSSKGRGFSIGSKGYVTSNDIFNNDDYSFYEYNSTTNSWTQVGDVPYGMKGHISFGIGAKGYLGVSDPDNDYQFTSEFWEYTPDDGLPSPSCLPLSEQEALAELYRKANGGAWINKWTGADESTWYGVTVSGCHVTELSLTGNNLIGTLPAELSDLTFLTSINLSDNQLSGTIPTDLLANAVSVDLSGNSLDGNLPTTINSNVLVLDLSSNRFSGNIPIQLLSLSQLTKLDLSGNLLTGSIPPEIENLASVTSIKLNNNQLSGVIPAEVINLYSVNAIDFSNNSLTGTIPIFNSNNLIELDLSKNQLTGALPEEFNRQNFQIDLSSNLLTSIPFMSNMRYPDEINVQNNFLAFGSLIPNNIFFYYFIFQPQKQFAHDLVNKNINDPVTFSPPITLSTFSNPTDDQIQWYKNGVAILGETNLSFSITSVQPGEEGIYTVKVTNPAILDFFLEATYLLNLDATTGTIPQHEREALLWLYYSTNGDSWANNTNWLNGDESTWAGITVTSGHVTGISLGNNNLQGLIPPELSHLDHLVELYLGSYSYLGNPNVLKGIIPPELGNLQQLQTLNLAGNKLSGGIPSELGNLSNLVSLNLSGDFYSFNYLEHLLGEIPPELGKLHNLEFMDISVQYVGGSIPPELGNLKKLKEIALGYNSLNDNIPPQLGKLSELTRLSLYANNLSGSIPTELGNLKKLEQLDLQINALTGSIPISLSTLPKLNYLFLRYNQLTGSIPIELSNLTNLYVLYLDGNQLTGPIPKELANLPALSYLILNNNQLSGSIPIELGNSTTLYSLQLQTNLLTGGIPKELGNATNLRQLMLGQNPLGGTIPVELSNLSLLQNLSINENQLTGNIPAQLGNLSQLWYLMAHNNQLTGTLPVEFGNLSQLRWLYLTSNQLSGTVPAEYGNLSQLQELYLADNKFSGAFPTSAGALANLRHVQLQSNQFTNIPLFTSIKNQLKVENNLLDFGDLEPNVGKGGYTYSPQGTQFPGGTISGNEECLLSIPFSTGGSSNIFAWAKDGSTISGATNRAYSKQPATTSDAGSYVVTVTNSSLPGLTISSLPFTVTIAPNPLVTPTTTGASGCSGEALVLTATGGTNGEYRWYSVASGGTPITGVVNNNYTTPNLTATTTYYVSSYNGPCETPRVPVVATISEAPTTAGNSGCINSAINLQAFGGTNGQYRWYNSSTGGSPIAGETNDTFTTPLLTTTTNYFVSIDYGGCESSRNLVTATISTPPNPSTINGTTCGTSTVLLAANGATNGQYRWYTNAIGGTALSGEVNDTFTTPSLSATTPYYVSINNGTCESLRQSVVATIDALPTTPSVTSAEACGTSPVTLTAAGGASGQYRWYTLASGGSPISGEVNGTYTTSSLTSTTDYYVSINNGLCESPRTSVTATILVVPSKPTITTGGSTSFCIGGSVALDGPSGFASYLWSDGNTSATRIISSDATLTLKVTDVTGCESTASDPVSVSVFTIPPPPVIAASGPLTFCQGADVTLSAPGYVSYLWSDGSIEHPRTLSTSTGAITLQVTTSEGCTSTDSDPVQATVNPLPPQPVITSSKPLVGGVITLCEENNETVTLSIASGFTSYEWSTAETTSSIVVNQSGDYSATVTDGNNCESPPSATFTVESKICNMAPVIEPIDADATIEGTITVNLINQISDPDDNLDLSTLAIIGQPISGALATLDADNNLLLDYSGISFSGTDIVRIRVCDLVGACVEQEVTIEVAGEITVYNALSPNGDGRNEAFIIEYVDILPETKNNRVTIFNRWGDLVFEIDNYDNVSRVFKGTNKNGNDLPSGTYYYKIAFVSGSSSRTGYISLKR